MQTPADTASLPSDAVHPEHAADFLRLQALWSKGQRFGLLLAAVDNPEYALELRQRLGAQRPGPSLTVERDASPVDILKALEAASSAMRKPAHLVFALDKPRTTAWWQHANVLRERWAEAWQGPLLMWLSSTDLDLLAHQAPDLWNWRDGVFGFTAAQATTGAAALLSLEVGPLLVSGADADALRQRLGELAQLRVRLDDDTLTAAHVDLEQAQLHLRLGEWAQAQHLARNALSAFEAQDRPADAGRASLVLASLLHHQGQQQEALTLLHAVMRVYQELGDVRLVTITKGYIADILQANGDLDEALRIRQDDELPVYQELGDKREFAVTKGKIADILQARGQLDEALRIRREVQLPVYQELGDVRELTITKGQIADILQIRGQLDEALRVRRMEELPIYQQLGDLRSLAITKGKIADILHARGQLDEALRIHQEEELPIYQQLGDVRLVAVTKGYIGDILQDRGQLDEALRIRQQDEQPVFQLLGDIRSLAVTKGKIADILLARGQRDEALRIRREEQLPIFQQLGDVRSILVCQTNVAQAMAQRGHIEDGPEIARLLKAAHAPAQRLGLPEAAQIEAIFQKIFGRPLPPAA